MEKEKEILKQFPEVLLKDVLLYINLTNSLGWINVGSTWSVLNQNVLKTDRAKMSYKTYDFYLVIN